MVTLVPCDTFILWPEFCNLYHLFKLSRKQFQAHKFVGQFTYGVQLNDSLLGLRVHSSVLLVVIPSSGLGCVDAGGLKL